MVNYDFKANLCPINVKNQGVVKLMAAIIDIYILANKREIWGLLVLPVSEYKFLVYD